MIGYQLTLGMMSSLEFNVVELVIWMITNTTLVIFHIKFKYLNCPSVYK